MREDDSGDSEDDELPCVKRDKKVKEIVRLKSAKFKEVHLAVYSKITLEVPSVYHSANF